MKGPAQNNKVQNKDV